MRAGERRLQAVGAHLGSALAGFLLLLLVVLFSQLIAHNAWFGVAAILAPLMLLVGLLWNLQGLMIGWLAGVPSVFIYINNYLKPATGLTIDRVLFAIFTVLFVLSIVLTKEPRWRPLALEKAMMLCLGIVLLSMLSAMRHRPPGEVNADIVFYTQGLLIPYLAFFIARQLTWTDQLLRWLFAALIICGLYLVICGALQVFADATFFMPKYLNYEGKPMTLALRGGRGGRAGASLGSEVEYGCVLITIAAISMFCFVQSRSVGLRVVLAAILTALAIGIILSKERAIWLAAIVMSVCVCIADRRARKLAAGMAAVAMMAAATMPLLTSTEFLDSLTTRTQEVGPLYNRIAGAATAANIFFNNPLFGIGFGQYAFQYARHDYAASFGDVPAQFVSDIMVPHNQYLFMLLMTGVSGFIPYLLVLLCAIRLLLAARRQPPGTLPQELAPYLLGPLAAVTFIGFSSDLIWFTYLMTLLYFLLGVLASRMGEAVR
jgi:O-antigen ligase